jgi:tryptophanyl-tRNA synthetase
MTSAAKQPIVLSGIQPSGQLLISHYVGAMRNWVAMQDTHCLLYTSDAADELDGVVLGGGGMI